MLTSFLTRASTLSSLDSPSSDSTDYFYIVNVNNKNYLKIRLYCDASIYKTLWSAFESYIEMIEKAAKDITTDTESVLIELDFSRKGLTEQERKAIINRLSNLLKIKQINTSTMKQKFLKHNLDYQDCLEKFQEELN